MFSIVFGVFNLLSLLLIILVFKQPTHHQQKLLDSSTSDLFKYKQVYAPERRLQYVTYVAIGLWVLCAMIMMLAK